MKRGDVVLAVMQSDFGKPRPAIVIQADRFTEHQSTVILPLTSQIELDTGVRVLLEPSPQNGLRLPSLVMIDKIGAVRADRIRVVVGQLPSNDMKRIDRALATFLGFD